MHVCAGGCKAEGQPLLSQFQGPLKPNWTPSLPWRPLCGTEAPTPLRYVLGWNTHRLSGGAGTQADKEVLVEGSEGLAKCHGDFGRARLPAALFVPASEERRRHTQAQKPSVGTEAASLQV